MFDTLEIRLVPTLNAASKMKRALFCWDEWTKQQWLKKEQFLGIGLTKPGRKRVHIWSEITSILLLDKKRAACLERICLSFLWKTTGVWTRRERLGPWWGQGLKIPPFHCGSSLISPWFATAAIYRRKSTISVPRTH